MISSSTIATLITALRTDDRRAHTLVVEDLVKLGAVAVEPLRAVLRDSNPNVRYGAARALGKIGDLRALGDLIFCLRFDPDPEVRKSAVWALHMGDERAVPALIEALSDKDEWVRFGAMIVLAKMGEPAVKPLIDVLMHPNRVVRESAAETLGRIGDRRAVEFLAPLLNDTHDGVRCQAAVALGRMGDARAVGQLIAVLHNPASDIRTKAIKALGQIGDVRAVEPLVDILYREQDRWMRLFAVEALGHIGDFRAIEPLLDVAYDDHHDLRAKAIATLGEIPFAFALDALFSLVNDPETYFEDQQSALFELGKRGDERALNGLIALLRDEARTETRMIAALTLAEFQTPEVVQALLDVLCEDPVEMRGHLLKALVKLGDFAAAHLANTLTDSPDANRRLWTVRALGEIATEDAVAALIDVALNGAETAEVRDEARAILNNLGHDPLLPG